MTTLVANFLQFLAHSQLFDHARFFKSWLRRIAPDTHLDLACGSTYLCQQP
jgi:DNA-directed RNA polymerase specialized sigma24 family protein